MRDQTSDSRFRSQGFTLLEILIAVFILGIVLTTIYAAYTGVLTAIRDLDDDSRAYSMARITLDRMSRDLTSLRRFGDVFFLVSEKSKISSREFSSLSVWSASHLSFEENGQSGQPASIIYFVRENKDGSFSLWRSDTLRVKPFTEKETGGGVVICENLQTLHLKFYDESGRDYDTWDTRISFGPQKGKPPVLVQIELAVANQKDAEKPHTLMTRVFLPVRK
jgi:general secretion pathway protein J